MTVSPHLNIIVGDLAPASYTDVTEVEQESEQIVYSTQSPGLYSRIVQSGSRTDVSQPHLFDGADGSSDEKLVESTRHVYGTRGLRAAFPCFAITQTIEPVGTEPGDGRMLVSQYVVQRHTDLYYHDNGELEAEIPYKTEPSYQLYNEALYDEQKYRAAYMKWDDIDNRDFINPLAMGKKDGIARYYRDDKTLRRTATYGDDVLDGLETDYDASGHPISETMWVKGVAGKTRPIKHNENTSLFAAMKSNFFKLLARCGIIALAQENTDDVTCPVIAITTRTPTPAPPKQQHA